MKENFAFGKANYLLLIVGFLIVVVGFILMGGPGSTEEAFEPDIFSTRRIVVAPMVCLGGFLFVIVAILWRPKRGAAPVQAAPAPAAPVAPAPVAVPETETPAAAHVAD